VGVQTDRRRAQGSRHFGSATSVRKVPLEAGLPPAPERGSSSWRAFLRAQSASMLAGDFLTVETAFLQRIYVLFFISLATRRVE
jgi:putative transposase